MRHSGIATGMYPLVNWMSGLAAGIVLLAAFALLGAMLFMIRLTTEDSDKHKQLREFVETLFGTPAHLRPGTDTGKGVDGSVKSRTAGEDEPFNEPCPGCGEQVTHEDEECPSCGLRLLPHP